MIPEDQLNCSATPRRELAQRAREHYEELSTLAHEYLSWIPQAIDLWELVGDEEMVCLRESERCPDCTHLKVLHSVGCHVGLCPCEYSIV